jgi:hypothetical protein
MTKLFAIATTALVFALITPAFAADEADVEEFERRVGRINTMAEKPGMKDTALQRISTETGVPIENVRNQHKRHPETGITGLLIANVLANETKKAPAVFLKQHAGGKKWLTLARENNVTLDKLNDRLERFQKAVSGGDKK